MNWKDTATTYGIVSRVLHAGAGILVIGMLASGIWMVDLDYYSPWYHRAPALHKSFGILVGLLFLARLAWRIRQGFPAPLAGWKRWEQCLSHAVHLALYLIPLLMIISGYLISTAEGHPVDVFGVLELPSLLSLGQTQADRAGDVHRWLGWLLIGLLILHVAGALKHTLVDRDATLRRMFGRPV